LAPLAKCIFCESSYNKEIEKCNQCELSNQPRTLVDWEIKKLLELDIIQIQPILDLPTQLGPFGLDIRLDTKFKKLIKSNNMYVDPIKPYPIKEHYQDVQLLLSKNDYFVIHPGEFTLSQTFEYISLPAFIGAGLDGKSSLGRLSLTVHTTAGSVDPGFKGHITLELFNNGGLPLILHPLQPVGRLIFHLTSTAQKPYQGGYSGQTEVRPSMAFTSNESEILRERKKLLP
jgi:dCTP deaminase